MNNKDGRKVGDQAGDSESVRLTPARRNRVVQPIVVYNDPLLSGANPDLYRRRGYRTIVNHKVTVVLAY
jgi:hypothetical protein